MLSTTGSLAFPSDNICGVQGLCSKLLQTLKEAERGATLKCYPSDPVQMEVRSQPSILTDKKVAEKQKLLETCGQVCC